MVFLGLRKFGKITLGSICPIESVPCLLHYTHLRSCPFNTFAEFIF